MFDHWHPIRWETPASERVQLLLVSLTDQGGVLSIVVEDTRAPGHRRLLFTFRGVEAYRNVLEQYLLDLWEKFACSPDGLGCTWIVPSSPWLASLSTTLVHPEEITHYLIATQDDVIEVLSTKPPEICDAPPGRDGDIIGKSTHTYLS
jgi:hypothetical protein